MAQERKKVAVLAAKRGNSVYRYRTRRRFDAVEELFPDKDLVDPHCNTSFIAQTNMLFVTLELAKEGMSVKEAWERAPKEFDRFEKSLRKMYPLSFIRGFEAHKDGYPHIHALFIFQDKQWRIKRHLAKRGKNRGKLTWRLADYGVKIREFEQRWRNGFVDVWGVTNPKRGGLNYILKYICGEKSKREGRLDYLSLALMWITGKRSYGVSGLDAIYTCITHTKTHQLTLNFEKIPGSEEETWTLLGIVTMIFNHERYKDPPNEIDLTKEKWLYGECHRLIERKKLKEQGEFKPYWEYEEP